MDDDQLEAVADELRNVYTRHRQMDFPRYRPTEGDHPYWLKLAREIVNNGLNPRHYITHMYERTRERQPIVFVRQITSPKLVKLYVSSAPSKPEEIEFDLRLKIICQLHTIDRELALGRTLEEVLSDSSLAIGAVVRYATAIGGGFEQLADQFREAAEREIYFEPLYKKLLTRLSA